MHTSQQTTTATSTASRVEEREGLAQTTEYNVYKWLVGPILPSGRETWTGLADTESRVQVFENNP